MNQAKPSPSVAGDKVVRDTMLDGYRAVAVLGVVGGHFIAYRGQAVFSGTWHNIQWLAAPISEIGVQLFFMISGFIITTLLVREEERTGTVNLGAFYIRRTVRIWPPFFCYLAAIYFLDRFGVVKQDFAGILSAGSFICNTGWIECGWWVAHSWSLAVEEQYYLMWPLLFILITQKRRPLFLILTIALLTVTFLSLPRQWHSNAISFACIATGALYATSGQLQSLVTRASKGSVWIVVVAATIAISAYAPRLKLDFLMPFTVMYILFATRELTLIRNILQSPPMQMIGTVSYSLYLWQQLFLGEPDQYPASLLPLWGLPVVTCISVILIEKPAIRAARWSSSRLTNHRLDNHRQAHSVLAE